MIPESTPSQSDERRALPLTHQHPFIYYYLLLLLYIIYYLLYTGSASHSFYITKVIQTSLLSPRLGEDSDESLKESDSTDEADKGGDDGVGGEEGGVTNLSSLVLDTDKQLMSLLKVREFVNSLD